jgi:hypothetical protein
VHGRSPKLLHLLINRVHTGGTAVCSSNRSMSIVAKLSWLSLLVDCAVLPP